MRKYEKVLESETRRLEEEERRRREVCVVSFSKGLVVFQNTPLSATAEGSVYARKESRMNWLYAFVLSLLPPTISQEQERERRRLEEERLRREAAAAEAQRKKEAAEKEARERALKAAAQQKGAENVAPQEVARRGEASSSAGSSSLVWYSPDKAATLRAAYLRKLREHVEVMNDVVIAF